MLCLTLTSHDMDENLVVYKENQAFAGCLELRIDYLDLTNPTQLEKAEQFPSIVDLPVILTCRRAIDGGCCTLDNEKRIAIIRQVAKGKFSFVDIESDVNCLDFENELKSRGIKIIRSLHSFDKSDFDFKAFAKQVSQSNEIPKMAISVSSCSDLLELFNLSKALEDIKDKIVVGMGEFGISSRILYRRFGSMLMYCTVKDTVHGMLDIKTMKTVYNADNVSERTEILGVIGNPIKHSLSPVIHNFGIRTLGLDSIYVPFAVDDVLSFYCVAEKLGIKGFSVTAPHKHAVISELGEQSEEVRKVNACNTVLRNKNMWVGQNTDYYACLSLFCNKNLRKALIIGAGGAAEALAFAFKKMNIDTVIINRTATRAKDLAMKVGCKWDGIENAAKYSGWADIIIQAVSVNKDIVTELKFSGNELVLDLVYNPLKTDFLKRAEQAGCKIITGWDFLLEQGKFQFKSFTGRDYPIERPQLP